MKILNSFSELYAEDFNISDILAMNQVWDKNRFFSMSAPRQTNALLLFTGCDADFFDCKQNKNTHIFKKSLFFIPAGSEYNWTFSNTQKNEISTILFEFILTTPSGDDIFINENARVLDAKDFKFNRILFESVVAEFSKPECTTAKIKASAYQLISAVLGEDRKKQFMRKNTRYIYEGIKYLEEDPLQKKNIEEIASMCNVSVGYFERLFKEYADCTPSQYRIRKKIEKAKLLLKNNTLTTKQIVEELDFYDYAYFCRIFKKACGCTPAEYRRCQEL